MTWLHMEFVLFLAQPTAEHYGSFDSQSVFWRSPRWLHPELSNSWMGYRTENSSRFRRVDDLGTVNVTLLPPINCSLYREQFDGKIMICAGDRVRQKKITKDYLVDIVHGLLYIWMKLVSIFFSWYICNYIYVSLNQ